MGGLVVVWANLWAVALPVMTSISVAGIFSVFLWRITRKGLPYRREECEDCVFEKDMRLKGYCTEPCAVNQIPTLPLLLFAFITTLSVLAVFYPVVVNTYVLPYVSSQLSLVVYGFLTATCLMSSVLLACYLLQERAVEREVVSRIAIVGTLAAIVLTPFLQVAAVFVPTCLFLMLVGIGIELQARKGKNLLGLRTIGFATLPLFVITLIGLLRVLQIIRIAGGIL
jgi:hypothetical protein